MSWQATEFDRALERLAAGEPLETLLAELARQPDAQAELRLAARMQAALPRRMPAARRASAQVELQRAFERERGPAARRRRMLPVLLLRAAALGLAAVLVLSSAVVVSADSLPGDWLYPVKRAAEEARVAMSVSAVGRARAELSLAANRLDELQRMADRGLPIAPEHLDALVASQQAVLDRLRGLQDRDLLERARRQASSQREQLQELRDRVPSSSLPALDRADAALERMGSVGSGTGASPVPGEMRTTTPASAAAPTTLERREPTATEAADSDGRRAPSGTEPATKTPGTIGAASSTPVAPGAASATLAIASTPLPSHTPPPPTLVPLDRPATGRAQRERARETEAARAAQATARADALRATLQAVRATEGADAARATLQALRERERDRRETQQARVTERAERPTPPPSGRPPRPPRRPGDPIRPIGTDAPPPPPPPPSTAVHPPRPAP